MAPPPEYRIETQVIHGGLDPQAWQGATLPPVFQTAAHRHLTAQNLSDTFAGKTVDHIYMRLTNPTNRFLEGKLAALEGGAGAVVTSSGMAAISDACLALLRTGDEFVSGNSLFMSTYILFTGVFKKYGITARLVESTDLDQLRAAISPKTRFIFLETIGNPKMDVPDLAAAAEIAHGHGLPLIVDNTLATPLLCRPLELGADVVVHSTTKYFSGHGDAVGGVIIDGGSFDWSGERFADFAPFIERKGPLAFLDKAWREHHINFGTTQSPWHSYLTALGLDTLALRMERHCSNAMQIAGLLAEREEVKWVNYPGLPDSPHHATASRIFSERGFGGLLAFGLADRETCFKFIERLKLASNLANLGDCKTLVIHPASSQYVSFDEQTRQELSITQDLVRLSVGIEAWQDIWADIEQALEKSRG